MYQNYVLVLYLHIYVTSYTYENTEQSSMVNSGINIAIDRHKNALTQNKWTLVKLNITKYKYMNLRRVSRRPLTSIAKPIVIPKTRGVLPSGKTC